METKDLTPTARQEIAALFEAEGVQPTDRLLAEIEDWAEGYHAPCDLELFQQEREKQERRQRLREQYMGMAMQAIATGLWSNPNASTRPDVIAAESAKLADALLARLDGEEG